MFEILETLAERHVTPTRVMIRVLARCCDCGDTQVRLKQNVDRCNQLKKAGCGLCVYHRMTDTRPWRSWKAMLDRVYTPGTKGFKHYGGRGISVDPDWLSFKNFWRDMRDGYADDLTIERIDVNGDYRASNCRWATNMEQQANKRNNRIVEYQGQQMHFSEFCRVAGVTKGGIRYYLNRYGTGDAAMAAYLKSTYPRFRASRKGYKFRKRSTTSSTAAPGTGS